MRTRYNPHDMGSYPITKLLDEGPTNPHYHGLVTAYLNRYRPKLIGSNKDGIETEVFDHLAFNFLPVQVRTVSEWQKAVTFIVPGSWLDSKFKLSLIQGTDLEGVQLIQSASFKAFNTTHDTQSIHMPAPDFKHGKVHVLISVDKVGVHYVEIVENNKGRIVNTLGSDWLIADTNPNVELVLNLVNELDNFLYINLNVFTLVSAVARIIRQTLGTNKSRIFTSSGIILDWNGNKFEWHTLTFPELMSMNYTKRKLIEYTDIKDVRSLTYSLSHSYVHGKYFPPQYASRTEKHTDSFEMTKHPAYEDKNVQGTWIHVLNKEYDLKHELDDLIRVPGEICVSVPSDYHYYYTGESEFIALLFTGRVSYLYSNDCYSGTFDIPAGRFRYPSQDGQSGNLRSEGFLDPRKAKFEGFVVGGEKAYKEVKSLFPEANIHLVRNRYYRTLQVNRWHAEFRDMKKVGIEISKPRRIHQRGAYLTVYNVTYDPANPIHSGFIEDLDPHSIGSFGDF